MSSEVTLKDLCGSWDALSRDYRPSAFWFWNGPMEPDGISASISKMVGVGIREVVIHPIHGLELEYMSDVYLDRLLMALKLFSQNDTKVWIYDDYGWPSGNVGGKLIEQHPEFRGWYLKFEKDSDGVVKATPVISDMLMDNAMGAPWANHCRGQLDTLSNDAVKCFIDMTHERIYEKCKSFFGSTIVGFFTDEPATMIPNAGNNGNFWDMPGLPWTHKLPELFMQEFRYSIETRYAELANSEPSQLKQDYWHLVKRLHSEAYHKQIGEWCSEHDVKYTGHLGEDKLLQQVRFAGSAYECLKYMDVPGVDQLSYHQETEERFIEQVLVSSITKHTGRTRSFCEAWGVSPLDLRLSKMYDQASMLALQGINDIALMGFHQSFEGINKYTYWPSMFSNSPWWDWFKEFADAFARTVSIISLGKPDVKYAVLYPQYQLEQESVFTSIYDETNVSAKVIDELGRGIYAAGETFDFVFPEILEQARVVDGKICFDNAVYDAILSPSEISIDSDSNKTLERLRVSGGSIYNGTLKDTLNLIKRPDRKDIDITHNGNAGDIRIFKIDYSDGKLIAIRNVTERDIELNVSSSKSLTEWQPLPGTFERCRSKYSLKSHATLLLSLTDKELASDGYQIKTARPIETHWSITTEKPNIISLDDLEFLSADGKWHKAVSMPLPTMNEDKFYAISIPDALRSQTTIPFKGTFNCGSFPEDTGLVYESGHLGSLKVNGSSIPLENSYASVLWDDSCRRVDIADVCKEGTNVVSGELLFKKHQTSIDGDAFYGFWKPMPSCDIFVCGGFKVSEDRHLSVSNEPVSLPVDLNIAGLPQYYGVVKLSTEIQIPDYLEGKNVGIEVEPINNDPIEVLINGNSIGKRITGPYNFAIPEFITGRMKIDIRMASTTANMLCKGKSYGIKSVSWITN